MKRITKIGTTQIAEKKKKTRVAAYCRVSTDSDEQLISLEAQKSHYESYIRSNDDWEYAGIYYDEGITGTKKELRSGLLAMMADCEDGEIDMVITKSISRFARNTLDCLKFIRQLKEKNIPVFFEKENINTMDAKGEVLLTIMVSLAQQESQSLSQNVKLGIQYRYQQGHVQVNHNRFLGYTKDEDGHLVIEPEGAKVIKRIYREYLEGASLLTIAKGLERDGILTGAGKTTWRAEAVQKILKNEKYMGDALLQKTYTVDFLNKKRVKNNGIMPQYYVENNHEAIIPKDIYMQVQEEMARRANLHSGQKRKKRVYSGKYALSSIVYCDKCGEIFRRLHWTAQGKKYIVWRCCNRIDNGPGACDAEAIREEDLQSIVVQAINKLLGKRDGVKEILTENIESALIEPDGISMEEIDFRLAELQRELLKVANSKGNYDDITNEIYRLRELKQNSMIDSSVREGIKVRVEEMQQFLKEQATFITEYDDQLVRKLVDRITVFDDHFEIQFKSGATIHIHK